MSESEWQSTSMVLPPKNQDVLFIHNTIYVWNGKDEITYVNIRLGWHNGENWFSDNHTSYGDQIAIPFSDVSHWMPLPSLPYR
ncbi:MAG TPA: DUF551 domain-containing protein [Candidatus Hodarchaeales archaeon]|nr:DUF551 domain-containing protein [Candidatus Hodarchaeales archaeon]